VARAGDSAGAATRRVDHPPPDIKPVPPPDIPVPPASPDIQPPSGPDRGTATPVI